MGDSRRRLAVMRFAPLVLVGCTALSGAASLEVGEDELQQAVDGGGSTTNPNPNPSPTSPIAPVIPETLSDAGFSRDASTKAGDASDPPNNDAGNPPPPPPIVDAGVDTGGTVPPTVVTFTKTLAEDDEMLYGPFKAKGGTTFDSVTTGSGDPDLYLRWGAPPNPDNYDCESDSEDATERCRRTVPANGSDVYLVVYAYEDCSYTLTVTYVAQ